MTNPVLDIIHQRRSIGKLSLPMPNQDELTQKVNSSNLSLQNIKKQIDIAKLDLPAGIYWISISSDNYRVTKKLLIL